MKTILLVLMLMTIGAVQAQVDQSNNAEEREQSAQDRIQQEPPRENQSSVDRAARATSINTQASQNEKSAEERIQSEKERSTGKPDKNPALENPQTVRPARLAEPPTTPK